jgi:hypothetical protein
VERTVFGRGRITILGSLPLEGVIPRGLPVRIEGDIAKSSNRRWTQDERFGLVGSHSQRCDLLVMLLGMFSGAVPGLVGIGGGVISGLN